MFRRCLRFFALMLVGPSAVCLSEPAYAYTECPALVEKIWAGDGGSIWVHLIGGGAAMLSANDPNKESVVAMAMTALVSSRRVVIRYSANNADCSAFGRSDFVGMYLL